MDRKKRKGVSPVIATVLLVAMVVVIAFVLFLWIKGLTQEAVTKFGGKNVDLVCNDVQFTSDYSNGILTISNVGNVPIYGFDVKITKQGSYSTQNLKDISSNWPTVGINQGGLFTSVDLSSQFSGATNVLLIPILVGTSSNGEKTHVCTEQQGQQVAL